MKIGIVPDIHGEKIWKTLIDNYGIHNLDCVVFLGDYVDSHTLSNEQILKNLSEIIHFKTKYSDKVVLLYGNHDVQYLHTDRIIRSTGKRAEMLPELNSIFSSTQHLFQNAYQLDNIVFTHAGIEHFWFEHEFEGKLNSSIDEQLNNPTNESQFYALHQVGALRGGRTDVGGIFWCDRNELQAPLQNHIQIVGHNPVEQIKKFTNGNATVYFCDCLKRVAKLPVYDTEKAEFI